MTYVVAEAPDGISLDTSAAISPEIAQQIARSTLLGQMVAGVAQYVGLETNGPTDITAERRDGILAAGLGLWLVQHCLRPGWVASSEIGHRLGAAARRNATLGGYLEGAHLALDLEGCASTGQAVIDYVNAWVEEVVDTYPVVLYVGYATGLTAQQLYEAFPLIHLYWSDAGPRQVSTRGFAVRQHLQTTCCGIPVDPDTMSADLLGGRLRWMKAA